MARRKLYVARAEMVLLHNSLHPLAEMHNYPDALIRFARAMVSLRREDGETGSVIVDLLPLNPRERRRHRRNLAKKVERQQERASGGAGALGGLRELFSFDDAAREALFGSSDGSAGWTISLGPSGGGKQNGGTGKLDLEVRRAEEALSEEMRFLDTAFRIQVLVRVCSPDKERATRIRDSLVAAFDMFTGRNGFQEHGFNLGFMFLSSTDIPGFRWHFERRFHSGLFRPVKRGVVSSRELLPFFRPPFGGPEQDDWTLRLAGGQPTPFETDNWEYRPDQIPLGRHFFWGDGVPNRGSPVEQLRLSWTCGTSQSGKTELAMNEFIHFARSGYACLFLDPHAHNLDRARRYLTDPAVAERLVEINLANADRQPTWNPLSMEGFGPEDIAHRANAVADAIISMLRLDTLNSSDNRPHAMITVAARSLLELAQRLPAELAPTIFQMPTILANERWRAAAMPFLSPGGRQFWQHKFWMLTEEVIGPTIALIEQLRDDPATAGLFGASRSTIDPMNLINQNKAVMVCLNGLSQRSRLVANLFTFSLMHGAQRRAKIPPTRRQAFYAAIDEVELYDGANSNSLTHLLEQVGKFGLYLHVLNEKPDSLKPQTAEALLAHRTRLMTGVLSLPGAEMLQREWSSTVDTPLWITMLDKHTFLAQFRAGRVVTQPYLVAPVPAYLLWAHCRDRAGVPALNRRIARNSNWQPVGETIAELNVLDLWIRRWLLEHDPSSPPSPGPATTGKPLTLVRPPSDGDDE